jgi:hypothetical protein
MMNGGRQLENSRLIYKRNEQSASPLEIQRPEPEF